MNNLNEVTEETRTDPSGYYEIRLPNGIYTINCLGHYSNDFEIEILKNVTLDPNEKIEINFYIGLTVE